MSKELDYSIIVPAYNEEAYLDRCLKSIHHAMQTSTYQGELIVVDNDSSDNTKNIALNYTDKVIFAAIHQIGLVRNTGAQKAKGKMLIFIDADCAICPKLLKCALNLLFKENILAGGVLISTSDNLSATEQRVIRLWNRISKFFTTAAGCFIFCQREAFYQAGTFDKRLYAGEEIELFRQLRKIGRRQKQKLVIIDEPKIDTSARKLRWYNRGYLFFWSVVTLLCPLLLRSKRWCHLWYHRPD